MSKSSNTLPEPTPMRGLQITLFVIAIAVLSTQSARHFFVKYFEHTDSILDKYREPSVKDDIEKAESLEALAALYDPAQKREKELDAQRQKESDALPEDKRSTFRNEFNAKHADDISRAFSLRTAIQDWEAKSKDIRKLRIFWSFGLGMVVVGSLVYFVRPWLGMAFCIPGVLEMIWWTSPDFNFGGTVPEYERLLNDKILFTNATLVLVVVLWLVAEALHRRAARAAKA